MGDLSINKIESRIFTIRGLQVMLDRDLSAIYHVEVKRLNEQVRRNIERFPQEFRFQLSKSHDGTRKLPYAFTEQGIAMLSAVLHSDIAIKVSIQVMQAFVAMRKLISANIGIIQRIETVEQKQIETDKKIDKIFNALESKEAIPKCGVFFDGQIFDAYILVNKIIKSAKQSIVLIDNYIDESVSNIAIFTNIELAQITTKDQRQILTLPKDILSCLNRFSSNFMENGREQGTEDIREEI
jgi:hypothetical protein